MNVIEKVEFNHPRMGSTVNVTFQYGKNSDDDWRSLSLGNSDESILLSRISSHSIDWNEVETLINGKRNEGEDGIVWVVTLVSEDKCRQSFTGILPHTLDENDLTSFFD